MKKRKGKGGAIRLFILIFLLAAAAAGARMAAGTVETMAAATEDAGQSTSAPDAAGGQDATAAAAEEDSAYDHLATELEKGRAYLLSLEERTPVEQAATGTKRRKSAKKNCSARLIGNGEKNTGRAWRARSCGILLKTMFFWETPV